MNPPDESWDDLSPEEQLAKADHALAQMQRALDSTTPENKVLDRRLAKLETVLDQHRAMARDDPEFRQAWIAQLLEKGATLEGAEEFVDRSC